MSTTRTLRTISEDGLDRTLPVWRLWQRVKQLGTWDPAAVDLARDAVDWRQLDALEREVLLHLTALFQGSEEAVTLDLLTLVGVVAAEGREEFAAFATGQLNSRMARIERALATRTANLDADA